MKPSSGKAKARRLQQWMRDAILAAFSDLSAPDVESTSMGASGIDVKLSTRARDVFPYAIECKNVERVNVWTAYEQAKTHAAATGLEPLVVISRNRTKPLVVVDAEHFIELTERAL